MFNKISRLSLSVQTGFMFLLLIGGTLSAFNFWADESALVNEVAHARTVADMVDAFRSQASKHGGFYVRRNEKDDEQKVGRYLASFPSSLANESGPDTNLVFHQKNPFLAVADYSEEVLKSKAAAKFRMVSDNPMNRTNKTDAFEADALRHVRQTKDNERWLVVGKDLRYVRVLTATAACLSCHGAPSAAPAIVRAKYPAPATNAAGGGYGFKLDDVMGLTSVTIPHQSTMQTLLKQKTGFWISISTVLSLLILAYWMMLRHVVKPLEELTSLAEGIANSDSIEKLKRYAPNQLVADEDQSDNQIHRQSFAIGSLYQAVYAAMQLLNRK